ncbi:hypothetical protein EB093_09260, partial [bacterium]|nr:hypothetical protein [bacterium]
SMSDATSFHLTDKAASHTDSPMTRVFSLAVVTLSDELTADITTKKVHLLKTRHPVKIDKYQFDKQTRDQLLKRIPDDVLVSGIVYLPKNLKLTFAHATNSKSTGITQVDSTKSDSQWHAIEQVGNELRLHYATRQQLVEIGFDESFYAAQKQALQQQAKLKIRLNQLEAKRHKIEFPADGLTPLGRQMLSNSESNTQQREKLEQIDQQIEALQGQLDEVNQLRSESELLFSGWVNIRLQQ